MIVVYLVGKSNEAKRKNRSDGYFDFSVSQVDSLIQDCHYICSDLVVSCAFNLWIK